MYANIPLDAMSTYMGMQAALTEVALLCRRLAPHPNPSLPEP